MKLYMMRHGIAEEWPRMGGDAERQLTDKGRDRTSMVARALKKMDITLDAIVSSPYVRAVQTAEIVADVIGFPDDILHDGRLTPAGRYEGISDVIEELSTRESILVAGHEPSMSAMISGICAQGGLLIEVKKASVTAIEVMRIRPSAIGALLWTLPPRLVEQLLA